MDKEAWKSQSHESDESISEVNIFEKVGKSFKNVYSKRQMLYFDMYKLYVGFRKTFTSSKACWYILKRRRS